MNVLEDLKGKKPISWVIVIVVLSLAFRLIFFGDAHFAGDEALFLSMSSKIASFKLFPVYGAFVTGSSTRVPGGGFPLFISIPMFIYKHPYSIILFVMLWGTLGQVLLYLAIKRLVNTSTAIVAVALTMFNPFFVFYSDSIWNPDTLFTFGALYLYLLGTMEDSRISTFFLGFILFLLPQFHLSAVHLILLTAIYLILTRPKINYLSLIIGSITGLATYIPYFAVDYRHHFKNTLSMLHTTKHQHFQILETLRAFIYSFAFPAGDPTYFVAKGSWFPLKEWVFFSKQSRIYTNTICWGSKCALFLEGLFVLSVLSMLISGIYFLLKASEHPKIRILYGVNIILLVLDFFMAKKAFYPHYSILFFPIFLIGPSWTISKFLNTQKFKYATLPLLVLLISIQGFATTKIYNNDAAVGTRAQVEASNIICNSRYRRISFKILVPRTRIGTYPMYNLCRILHHKHIIFTSHARVRFYLCKTDTICPGKLKFLIHKAILSCSNCKTIP